MTGELQVKVDSFGEPILPFHKHLSLTAPTNPNNQTVFAVY